MSACLPTGDRDLARLRWRCRRGMLELDLVLLDFVERQYPRLTPAQRQAFHTLLELEDAVLLDFLAGGPVPDPWQDIIARLRQC